MKLKIFLIFIIALLTVLLGMRSDARANDLAYNQYVSQEALKAIYDASKEYKIDAQKLIIIARVESNFVPNAIRVNKNNTIDYGMFQVNSIHWTTTCLEHDVFSIKGNAMCAAKLLFKIKKKHSRTDKLWLGRYHSKTPSLKLKYYNLLLKHSIALR